MADASRIVSVAVPLPVQTEFSYLVPADRPLPARGCRVVVPFGPRKLVGVATGRAPAHEGVALKEVLDVLETAPIVPEPLLDLAEFVAEHYLAPPGECYRLVMPPQGLSGSRTTVRVVDGAPSGDDPLLAALAAGPAPLSALLKRFKRGTESALLRLRAGGRVAFEQTMRKGSAPLELQSAVLIDAEVDAEAPLAGRAQREVVARLTRAGGRSLVAELTRDRPALRGAVNRLAAKGVVRLESERRLRAPNIVEGAEEATVEPTVDQSRVLAAVTAALATRTYEAFLLHGVTGSGKTEVYFRAAEAALAQGRSVLILVPEIALTPLLVRAATARFGDDVAVLHSELSAGERYDQWWLIRDRQRRIVIGARSAVFAPLADVGLIVVDEEHEGAYKQEESPRYNARDLAVVRARREKAALLLGSATPSVESYDNAAKGKYTLLSLPERTGAVGLPRVEVVDRRAAAREGLDTILTPQLQSAIESRLERGEQVLLLLNRRGFATSLLCRECGAQASCRNCSVLLALHYGGTRALCHYCGFEGATPEACAACNGTYLRLAGHGTERVAERVQAQFPRARVSRLDRDVARRRGAVASVLRAFEKGEVDIVVGTQMIAKGHDFPRVTLVGVVDADVGLGLPDFRASERTFQLLTQVSGRAGRKDLPGEVLLQTHLPEHYALKFACDQDYVGFFEREMEFRRTMGYPPCAALVNVVVKSRDAADAESNATAIARELRRHAAGRFAVLGPARAPIPKLREEHRHQVLLKGTRPAMREAVRRVLVARFGAQAWPGIVVDVDPISVL